jgi:uncharacterized cupin superfamily protein
MVNIEDPVYDEPRDYEGFTCRRARISRQAGAERVGASLWELPPGQAAYPYHAHLTEEELLIVLEGAPSLRTESGWRELAQGEVVSFPRGLAGAHQLLNRTAEVVRFLAVSTNTDPDIVLQLDSGKVGAFERRPDGGGLRVWFKRDDECGYIEGETPPA